jgi:hypothetical protein
MKVVPQLKNLPSESFSRSLVFSPSLSRHFLVIQSFQSQVPTFQEGRHCFPEFSRDDGISILKVTGKTLPLLLKLLTKPREGKILVKPTLRIYR